ncbi:PepSY domain-containing protein [Metabacillus indicus]|uniref:PepSY domain-containing protein n=1 Tax=Metabacillus indicus TaxID=246786 RepID=UPI003CE6DACF
MKKTAAILTGALIVGGIGLGSQFITPGDKAQAEKTAEEQNLKISYERAKEIVLKEKKGSISEMELEQQADGWVYEAEVKSKGKEYDFTINADTGEVTEMNEDDDSSDNGKINQDRVKVTMEEAKKLALKEVKGEVTEAELESDDGQAVYKFEIMAEDGREAEVEISAESGEMVKTEWEDEE